MRFWEVICTELTPLQSAIHCPWSTWWEGTARPTFLIFEAMQPHLIPHAPSLFFWLKHVFQADIQAGFDHLKRRRLCCCLWHFPPTLLGPWCVSDLVCPASICSFLFLLALFLTEPFSYVLVCCNWMHHLNKTDGSSVASLLASSPALKLHFQSRSTLFSIWPCLFANISTRTQMLCFSSRLKTLLNVCVGLLLTLLCYSNVCCSSTISLYLCLCFPLLPVLNWTLEH